MIKAESEGTAPELQEYSPGVPMIKLTLGLVRLISSAQYRKLIRVQTKSVTQLCSPEDPTKVEIKLNDDHDIDPYWCVSAISFLAKHGKADVIICLRETMWSAMKVDAKK